jgi:hypothetical protein
MGNPQTAHETPLHPVKIGIWYAVPHRRTAGPSFFFSKKKTKKKKTKNSECHTNIVYDFIAYFTGDEISRG